MSQQLINHSPDLKKLWDEGYEMEIREGFLLVHHVPYLNRQQEIKYGTLVSTLTLAGDRTTRPDNHVAYFIGELPCNRDGTPISQIISNDKQVLNNRLTINYTFSSKPLAGYYNDYYEKIATYVAIISSQAKAIDPTVSEKTFELLSMNRTESVFNYMDTNSSRAFIHPVSKKLDGLRISIIGLGGSGSYILDLVSKTMVREIHIFDRDIMGQHNAFRSPGSVPIEILRERKLKVQYYYEIYSRLHRGIFPHEYNLVSSNVDEVSAMDFVFICMDNGSAKKTIINHLIFSKIPFIDLGIGVLNVNDSLLGQVRITTSTPDKVDHIGNRISFHDGVENDYSQNIQVAELNALNAALAVIKWKKLFGFYQDLNSEFNSIYSINDNRLFNDDYKA